MQKLITFLAILLVANFTLADITFTFINECKTTIWPALHHGASTRAIDPLPAGLSLKEGETFVTLPLNIDNEPLDDQQEPLFSGRVWARQYCESEDGQYCKVGDCSNSSCWENSATNTTLLEFSIKPFEIYYDISLGK